VLFEMLTGRAAFARDTQTDTLAAVIDCEPDWPSLPPSVPPAIVRMLRRCLAKEPRVRLRDIGDARAELEETAAGVSSAPAETRLLSSRPRVRLASLAATRRRCSISG
jgi:eukaryotic-like serine/threonine-protein kinase